jgi:hypothetical protein
MVQEGLRCRKDWGDQHFGGSLPREKGRLIPPEKTLCLTVEQSGERSRQGGSTASFNPEPTATAFVAAESSGATKANAG